MSLLETTKESLHDYHVRTIIGGAYDLGARLDYDSRIPTAYWRFEKTHHEIVVGEQVAKTLNAKGGDEAELVKVVYRHERAHALFTCRDLEGVHEYADELEVPFRLVNLLEDIRVEYLDRKAKGKFEWLRFMDEPKVSLADVMSLLYWCKVVELSPNHHPLVPSGSWKVNGIKVTTWKMNEFFTQVCNAVNTFEIVRLAKKLKDWLYPEPSKGEEGERASDEDSEPTEGESEETTEGSGDSSVSDGTKGDMESERSSEGSSEGTEGNGDSEKSALDKALEEAGYGSSDDECEMSKAQEESELDELEDGSSRAGEDAGQDDPQHAIPTYSSSHIQQDSSASGKFEGDQTHGHYAQYRMKANVAIANRIAQALSGLIERGRGASLARRGNRVHAPSLMRARCDQLFHGIANSRRAKPRLLVITDMSGSMSEGYGGPKPSDHAATINLGIAQSKAVDSTHVFTSEKLATTFDQRDISAEMLQGAGAMSGSEGIASYLERHAKFGLAHKYDMILCITDGQLTDGTPDWKVLERKGLDRIAAIYVGNRDMSRDLKKHFKRHVSVKDAKEVGARLRALLG